MQFFPKVQIQDQKCGIFKLHYEERRSYNSMIIRRSIGSYDSLTILLMCNCVPYFMHVVKLDPSHGIFGAEVLTLPSKNFHKRISECRRITSQITGEVPDIITTI